MDSDENNEPIVKKPSNNLKRKKAIVISDDEGSEDDTKPPPPKKHTIAPFIAAKAAKLAGPSAPGSKNIPDGAPDALAGLCFVFTGELSAFSRDEAIELAKRFGGYVFFYYILVTFSQQPAVVLWGSHRARLTTLWLGRVLARANLLLSRSITSKHSTRMRF